MTTSNNFTIHTHATGPTHTNELVTRPDLGEFEGCDACPKSLLCLAGGIAKNLIVARTVAEQTREDSGSLPCVHDGKVMLRILSEEETDNILNLEYISGQTIAEQQAMLQRLAEEQRQRAEDALRNTNPATKPVVGPIWRVEHGSTAAPITRITDRTSRVMDWSTVYMSNTSKLK